jgi:periplasmic divalent cation tolerance protein
MEKLVTITTTFERKEDAERIAGLLIDRRLIACGQISAPITSIYKWQGRVVTATEFLLSLKTLAKNYPKVEQLILQEHPYQTPEIVAQEISFVSKAYKDWLSEEVA